MLLFPVAATPLAATPLAATPLAATPLAATPLLVAAAPVVPNAAGRWRGGPAAESDPGTGRKVADPPVTGAASPAAGRAPLVAGGCCAWTPRARARAGGCSVRRCPASGCQMT